ncbi:MAG: metallophosphoesterase [Desulfomonilaceae bacterium]
MKIGVLSDTHLRTPDKSLDYILDVIFADTDMILHAGDIVTRSVLMRLEERGVLAVCGNMDDYDVYDMAPQTRIINCESKKIALIHGWGSKEGLADRIIDRFAADAPDIIIHGHSHVPFWGEVKGVALFNPGSTSRNVFPKGRTVGVLEIFDGSVEASFIELDV